MSILAICPLTRSFHDLWKRVFCDATERQTDKQTGKLTLRLYNWIGPTAICFTVTIFLIMTCYQLHAPFFGSKRCLGGNTQAYPQTVQTVHFHEGRTPFCTVCTQWGGNSLFAVSSANKQMHCCEKFKWNRKCGRQNSTNISISFLTKLKMLRIYQNMYFIAKFGAHFVCFSKG